MLCKNSHSLSLLKKIKLFLTKGYTKLKTSLKSGQGKPLRYFRSKDMKKKLLFGLGLTGLLCLPNFASTDTDDLKRRGLFNAFHSEQLGNVPLSTSDLVASMVDKSDAERFEMANQYVQAHELTTRRYMNLLEAMRILGMHSSYTDELTAFYAAKRQGKFTNDTLYKLLNSLSLRAYLEESSERNWAGQIVSVHLKKIDPQLFIISNI